MKTYQIIQITSPWSEQEEYTIATALAFPQVDTDMPFSTVFDGILMVCNQKPNAI